MTLTVTVDQPGLERLRRRLERLAVAQHDALLESMVAAGESQTRRRIESERQAPTGEPWQNWSTSYAETRHSGQSLLIATGSLLDSITSFVDAQTAGWGTNKVYAAIHQLGGKPSMRPGPAGIPARPFMGLSEDNLAEMDSIIDDYVDGLLFGGAD